MAQLGTGALPAGRGLLSRSATESGAIGTAVGTPISSSAESGAAAGAEVNKGDEDDDDDDFDVPGDASARSRSSSRRLSASLATISFDAATFDADQLAALLRLGLVVDEAHDICGSCQTRELARGETVCANCRALVAENAASSGQQGADKSDSHNIIDNSQKTELDEKSDKGSKMQDDQSVEGVWFWFFFYAILCFCNNWMIFVS